MCFFAAVVAGVIDLHPQWVDEDSLGNAAGVVQSEEEFLSVQLILLQHGN